MSLQFYSFTKPSSTDAPPLQPSLIGLQNFQVATSPPRPASQTGS